MDFSVISQLRTKKFWWMDVIFYFVISLLVATVLSWLIFLIKDGMISDQISLVRSDLLKVGTQSQKDQEKEVITYQQKISDFSNLLGNHQFASNVFAFVQAQTMPDVWFKQFSMDEKNDAVQLSGEADNLDALSAQVANFESEDNKKYIKDISTLNSTLGNSSRTEFNIDLVLNQSIFSYLSVASAVLPATLSSAVQQTQTNSTTKTIPAGQTTPVNSASANSSANTQQTPQTQSSEKLITAFHLLLKPEVIGVLDETNYIVTLNVPYGTNVKSLITSMIISPEATVSPASGAAEDFTDPVTYTVTAQDGSTQDYQVKVIVAAPPAPVKKSNQSGSAALTVIISVVIIAAIALVSLLIWRRMQAKKTNF